MTEAFRAFLAAIPLVSLTPWLRLVLHWLIARTAATIEDHLEELCERPESRAWVEVSICFIEDGIALLIGQRTRRLMGLPCHVTRRWRSRGRPAPPSFEQLMGRWIRLLESLDHIERVAQRRAERLLAERAADPLGLRHDDHPRLVATIIMSAVLSCPARAAAGAVSSSPFFARSPFFPGHHVRGPPLIALDCPLPPADCLGRVAAETAPARPPQSLPGCLRKTSNCPLAKSTKREHNREQERSKNMTWANNGSVNFCGANGASYKFERFGAEQDWAKVAGVVLFAAPEGKSWRIIRVADQGGVEGDVATFWRWREARRYGATAIFVRRNADVKARRAEMADLAQGLDPVFASNSELNRELLAA